LTHHRETPVLIGDRTATFTDAQTGNSFVGKKDQSMADGYSPEYDPTGVFGDML
jgi:hypothetical protein